MKDCQRSHKVTVTICEKSGGQLPYEKNDLQDPLMENCLDLRFFNYRSRSTVQSADVRYFAGWKRCFRPVPPRWFSD